MNKDNVFRSSDFYMRDGDVLHILIIECGVGSGSVTWELVSDDGGTGIQPLPDAPIALPASDITTSSFTANWNLASNSEGYILDVSEDIGFTTYVAGYSDLDVGDVNNYPVIGLNSDTTYYYRIRAYNQTGTGLNSNVITTATIAIPLVDLLMDLDGNVYNTITVGDQEWLVENFRVTQYDDATPIPLITDDTQWADGINQTAEDYGALYNWYAATYSTAGASIAPSGWHLPTAAEFYALELEIDPLAVFGINVAGGKMKEIGTTHWTTPNTDATNSSGFTAIPSGIRIEDGTFGGQGVELQMWGSDDYGGGNSPLAKLVYNDGIFYTTGGGGSIYDDQNRGFSIRLIKNDSTDPGTMTDYDGNVYPTVKIGTQVWMAENLKVEHYNNGVTIPNLTDDGDWAADTSGAMCYYNNDTLILTDAYCYYDNNVANQTIYGNLYNWLALTSVHGLTYLERNGVQETGWRIATIADCEALGLALGVTEVTSGGYLKEVGTDHWDAPNTGAIDAVGFTALPSGYRDSDATFLAEGQNFYIWNDAGISYISSYMSYDSESWNIGVVGDEQQGFAVRLVRDVVTPSGIQYVSYTDGAYSWRKGVRDGYFVVDRTLTSTGFAGIENTDWENIKTVL